MVDIEEFDLDVHRLTVLDHWKLVLFDLREHQRRVNVTTPGT